MKLNLKQNGVTIIELLVVIGVMSVLMVIMIPQVRVITKDRSIREAARIVGASFSDAVNTGKTEGFAGIALARNGNIFRDSAGGDPIYYAAYEMYQLKQPVSYVGNQIGDTAEILAAAPVFDNVRNVFTFQVEVPEPLSGKAIESNSYIRFNGGKTSYRISGGAVNSMSGMDMVLTCDLPLHLPQPPAGDFAFEVIPRPEIRQTSRMDMPRGYVINLNYSGQMDFPTVPGGVDGDDASWTSFSQVTPLGIEPVFILFDSNGGIDRIYPNGFGGPEIIPDGSVHLCIAPDDVQHTFTPGNQVSDSVMERGTDLLDDGSVKWISINHVNGSVVVNDSAKPTTPVDTSSSAAVAASKVARMMEALTLTGKRQAASQ